MGRFWTINISQITLIHTEQLTYDTTFPSRRGQRTGVAFQPPISIPQSPSWIAAERWAALPAMLRAALAGAELIDGEVQGRTPYLSTLLRTRYGREVGGMVAEADLLE